MSISTLPRLIAANTDVPTYFMHADVADCTILRYTPTLPEGPFRWATPSEIRTPAIELTLGVLAELLHLSGLEPDALDDDAAVGAVGRALEACHCDLTYCAAEVGADIAEHAECAGPRYNRCVIRASRLLGVEV